MRKLESRNGPRSYLHDAIKFWEPRRIPYNLVLTAVTVVWFTLDWSHFRPGFNLQLLLALVILAGLANICYCAAYLVDIPLQHSSFRAVWRRRRWWLWLAGVLFAALLASYWINDEIYPGVARTNPTALALTNRF
jgi:hypothetical protein